VRKKHLALVALAVTGMLTLAACGDDGGHSMGDMSGMDSSSSMRPSTEMTGPDSSTEFNSADVAFATNMIPHHQQAVEMAELAGDRAESQEVKDLAAQIGAAQGPEIETMTGWLTAWGEPIPDDTGGMDMSGSMPGMMSMSDMNMLRESSGAGFDRMFLAMMIRHHQGAIEMARTEQADGANEAAMQLAEEIEAAQTAEITMMRGILN